MNKIRTRKMKKNTFYILLFLLVGTLGFAQQKRVTTTVDSTKIKIGAQLNLTLKTSVDTLSSVVFPEGQTFGALEVLESYPTDTVKEKDRYVLTKRYGFTQFDSGRFMIPSLPVLINKKPFLTDSISVEVMAVKVDTLKQKMFDIKGISEVESPAGNWWKWVLGILLLAGIGVLIFFLAKKYKRKKDEEIVYATPIEKASSMLKNLEKKELLEKGEVKNYYSELTDIARTYIEEEIQVPAMESTTSEVIVGLRNAVLRKKMKLSQETVENLEKVLRQADLVKFAKSKPLDFEIVEDRKRIEKTIFTLHKAIPKEEEIEDEVDFDAERRERLAKKKRQQRNAIIGFVSAFVLFAGLGYYLVSQGIIFGNSSKQMLEGEWVKSEYGNPGILIETPKVLMRQKEEKLPKETMALIKEMQLFSYGDIWDNFYVMVSTNKFKQETQIDLSKALEGSLQLLEKNGAANMIVKQEDYQTREGISGKKGYGTFDQIDPQSKKSIKVYYEVLFFSQDGGLQQIMIFHKEGDEYANQIAERILESVELKRVN